MIVDNCALAQIQLFIILVPSAVFFLLESATKVLLSPSLIEKRQRALGTRLQTLWVSYVFLSILKSTLILFVQFFDLCCKALQSWQGYMLYSWEENKYVFNRV